MWILIKKVGEIEDRVVNKETRNFYQEGKHNNNKGEQIKELTEHGG